MTKGSETRQRIITKSAPLFNRKGFEGCSMQDIVKAVGLEKGSLYGHFETKEDLAIAAFEYAWKETSNARLSKMDTVENSIGKLKIHINHVVSLPSFPGGCPLINTVVDSDDGNATLKKIARDALKEWRIYLKSIVEEGKSRKEIRAEVDPGEVATLIISLLEGAAALERLDKKSGFLANAGKHLNSYLDWVASKKA
jgi:TetR/AcrR family transcriptional regulator, transcriptional repressor for nem operon